jgi:hypothetical protein
MLADPMAETTIEANTAALLRYTRRLRIYNRIGRVCFWSGIGAMVLAFIIALAWWSFTGGQKWPTWLENTIGVILGPATLVVLIGQVIRFIWWPILESKRRNLLDKIELTLTSLNSSPNKDPHSGLD